MKCVVDALARYHDPFGGQAVTEFAQGNIRFSRQNCMQPILSTGEFPLLLTADLSRMQAPRLAPLPDKNNRTRSTHAKPPNRRAAARAELPDCTALIIRLRRSRE